MLLLSTVRNLALLGVKNVDLVGFPDNRGVFIEIMRVGSVKVCAYDAKDHSPTKGHRVRVVLSEDRMQILRALPHR